MKLLSTISLVGLLFGSFLHGMEKQEVSLEKDPNSMLSWLPREIFQELSNYCTNKSSGRDFLLLKHQEFKNFCTEGSGFDNYFLTESRQNVFKTKSDGAILFYCLKNNTLNLTTLLGHTAPITCLYHDKKNNRLFSASRDNTIKIWDLNTGSCVHTLMGHTVMIKCLAFDEERNQLFSAGAGDYHIKIWDLETGALKNELVGHTTTVHCLAFDSVKKHLYSGSLNETFKWDVANNCMISNLLPASFTTSMAIHSKERLLFICSSGCIYIWNLDTDTSLKTIDNGGLITDCIYDMSRNRLMVFAHAKADFRDFKIWDIQHENCLSELTFHGYRSHPVAFQSDSNWLLLQSSQWCLEDVLLRKHLDTLSLPIRMIHNTLFDKVYDCWRTEKELDLSDTKILLEAYNQLPIELQETIKKLITVIVPSIIQPIVQNEHQSWSQFALMTGLDALLLFGGK